MAVRTVRGVRLRPSHAGLLALIVILAGGCGEGAERGATAEHPEEMIIDETLPADQVETETSPTPQTSTGGRIPYSEPSAEGD